MRTTVWAAEAVRRVERREQDQHHRRQQPSHVLIIVALFGPQFAQGPESIDNLPSCRTAILPMFPVDAARLSGHLFSEVRAAERPCAKYQQQATDNNEYEGHGKAGQEMRPSIRLALEEQSIHNSHRE